MYTNIPTHFVNEIALYLTEKEYPGIPVPAVVRALKNS
jgi:hypothetical protein